MNPDALIQQLAANPAAIRALVGGFPSEALRWKPTSETWSPLEVINHLYDEEREDFRAHLQGVLHQPPLTWTPIAPQNWVSERRYNERDFETSLDNFLRERAQSLTWLGSLKNVDWQAAYELSWGRLTAGELLASWAAHDLLHLRQFNELRYAWLAHSSEVELAYAGSW
jgi:hypothetical protein